MELLVLNDTCIGATGNAADAEQGEETSGNGWITRQSADAVWEVSSRCGGNGSCVEVARLRSGAVAIRDGKLGAAGPILEFSPQEWTAFVWGVKAGEFG
jgi:Domain of unknown function (DUF397)